ncbi:molybdopterin oxidoreductase [Paramagnetospirillum kuznetsovii]|uniref:Molybdopterin oxidoreductase n=1 Tax=Paramagnetospirillum kuznetsovii TaxID=2053833 RepID=A0A364NV61_9PROT|nr:molybdopterin-dependent oxidoreductase [Paramagnetospirillum kuznetsovii]RAU20968.1 molybdopterin oxidoreductase [Paramagnetospirillum kuznetsovii]
MSPAPAKPAAKVEKVATYCYQCVAGPDLMTVKVVDGIATEIEPNHKASGYHPAEGKVCVKAFGLIQKAYSPHRILTPMKRTNPKKGKDQDPGFVPISWDEAMGIIADKLNTIRAEGLLDEAGYPKVAASFGGAGTPTQYMGSLTAWLSAWGPIDFGFGSGQGVKCYHSEHLYGEFWHRGYVITPDTPRTNYIISCGNNSDASAGVCGVYRHAEARGRGMKKVQVEPHLSVTGACASEWLPIRPKTDAAFLFALLNVMTVEARRDQLDIPFLRDRTSSPYLVGPNGFYLRDVTSEKPLIWDEKTGKPVPFDTPGAVPALEGRFAVAVAMELGADEERWELKDVSGTTAFTMFAEHIAQYTPAWAAKVCDVPEARIRKIANEFLEAACVGQTIEIEGKTMPYRPVAVTLGKTVNNGWGGAECCWGRTMLTVLVGALEVPGGTIGTTIRINRPVSNRLESFEGCRDGFMEYPFNPTDRDSWKSKPSIRNAYSTLVPLVGNSSWSPALGPTQFSYMFLDEPQEKLPRATFPEFLLVYRTNPVISFWDTDRVASVVSRMPFVACFAVTLDETNHFADILLPDRTDLEGLQLIRIGGTKFQEQYWDCQGFALRQPSVQAQGESRDFTDIATDLAARTGLLEKYNAAVNRGSHGVPLKGANWDFSLPVDKVHTAEEIWDASCKSASAELTDGKEAHGLDWWRQNGFRTIPFPVANWFLTPALAEKGLRYELPYQERLTRIGRQLGNRLREFGINWWDRQLEEYRPLFGWHDFPKFWEDHVVECGGKLADFPFWVITARSMQYAWGSNMHIPLMREVSGNVKGHDGVVMNPAAAVKLGVREGDRIEVSSPIGKSVQGRVVLSQGIRPDTILMMSQFDHWATPVAKDFDVPSMNKLTAMSMSLTDATGSAADLTRVGIRKVGERA